MGYAGDLQSIGLIGGGAEGFIKGWQDADDRKMKQMELDSKLQTDADTRQRAQVMQAVQLKQANLAQSSTDPTQLEDAPMTPRQQGQQMIEAGKSGMRLTTDPTTGDATNFTYDTKAPVNIAAQAKGMNAGYAGERMDLSRQRLANTQGALDERKNQNASKAGSEIEHAVAPMKKTQQNLSRAQGMLDGSVPLSSQNFNLLQQDLIQATAPGGVATEGKMNREMMETYAQKINELKGKFGGINDIRDAQPQVVNQMRSLIGEIKGEYDKAMEQQASDWADNYSANTNPKVQDTIKNKLQRYAPNTYQQRYGTGAQGQAQGLVSPGLTQQPQGLVAAPAGGQQLDPVTAAKLQRLQELKAKAGM